MHHQPNPVELHQRATQRAVAVAATGQPSDLDADLVDACVTMFLPGMSERGRAAGIVGPAVLVPDDATPQQRLLAAMGRTR